MAHIETTQEYFYEAISFPPRCRFPADSAQDWGCLGDSTWRKIWKCMHRHTVISDCMYALGKLSDSPSHLRSTLFAIYTHRGPRGNFVILLITDPQRFLSLLLLLHSSIPHRSFIWDPGKTFTISLKKTQHCSEVKASFRFFLSKGCDLFLLSEPGETYQIYFVINAFEQMSVFFKLSLNLQNIHCPVVKWWIKRSFLLFAVLYLALAFGHALASVHCCSSLGFSKKSLSGVTLWSVIFLWVDVTFKLYTKERLLIAFSRVSIKWKACVWMKLTGGVQPTSCHRWLTNINWSFYFIVTRCKYIFNATLRVLWRATWLC